VCACWIRVEAVLSLVSHSTGPQRHRAALQKANRAILAQPLIKIGEMDRTAEVSIPSIDVGYVVPRFRFAVIRQDPISWWRSVVRLIEPSTSRGFRCLQLRHDGLQDGAGGARG
jgi:hypothetical protein